MKNYSNESAIDNLCGIIYSFSTILYLLAKILGFKESYNFNLI